jgi:hypothetical protein
MMVEASFDQLPATEGRIRKCSMVYLYLEAIAISCEDEAHLSQHLSLDDVGNVVDHVCSTFQEMNIPIDWDTIRDVVLLILLDDADYLDD